MQTRKPRDEEACKFLERLEGVDLGILPVRDRIFIADLRGRRAMPGGLRFVAFDQLSWLREICRKHAAHT